MPFERDLLSDKMPIGCKMPEFSLPSTDGKQINNSYFDGAKGSLIVFSCNHCPYVKGSEKMLIELVGKYSGSGLRTVAISSNDAEQYPEDSFDKMKEKSLSMNLPYPYLYDESQTVAKSFDAACTPECYLFDASGMLAFHGQINNSPKNPDMVTDSSLDNAVSALLAGKKPSPAFVHPVGCTIKWK